MGQSRRSQQRAPERRAGGRPQNGDTRPCPHCAKGQLEFNERFRRDGAMHPAWVCDNARCTVKYAPARADDSAQPLTSKGLVRESQQLRATALRALMKSRARVARTVRRAGRTKPGK